MARAYVTGLQGDDPRYIRANAGCKHFDVYGGPENIPVSSFSFNAVVSFELLHTVPNILILQPFLIQQVSDRDWRLTHLPAFKECVAAGTYSLMCSFNG